ncbi:sporulation protein [Streptomyces sp. BH-SS-21]|uniref:Sporulation protein n=1 Tax=Streptomyces liliiviolaceus TaxID=2823109 RepID=A0A940XS85_9ACTN|nr:sporulation protein [Streptomyces liliiviolaceus]MBQ0847953.1 sporulation protein [Streptomyces liliiviolaceus]
MVFKRLLGSLGVGGPTVETVLSPAPALPGGTLSGEIRLRGGGSDADIEHIALELVAGVEAEHEDEHEEGESESGVVFERFTVGGGFRLAEDEERTVPFTVTLPWETPVTELYGQELGIVLGLRTELSVAGVRDKGDLDRLTVTPRPAQEAILEAFGQLGFGFRSADLELGRIGGTGQQLPFYQELELTPSPAYAHAVNEIEVTFLAAPTGMEVVLEADKRGGLPSSGDDTLTRFTVSHEGVGHQDWNAVVDGWVRELVEHRESYDPDAAYGHDRHELHERSRPGIGAGVAAGAAGLALGVAGGLVAAEVVDEAGDFFEGDEGEQEEQEEG